MSDSNHLVFFKVPPPRSQAVVDLLADLKFVTEAAAVYTETDVVARIACPRKELRRNLAAISDAAPAADVSYVAECDAVILGPSCEQGRFQGHSSVFAFARCKVDTESTNFKYAVDRLRRIPEVRYAYPVETESEVVLQVVAPDKISLDHVIMREVQHGGGVVHHTRTFITVNDMHWSNDGAPRTREQYRNKVVLYPVFIAVAKEDHKTMALPLVEQIYKDTQIRVWHYGLIKEGRPWPAQIDDAIKAAECYLPLISENFVGSEECQREFGKLEMLSDDGEMCCLVLPGCSMRSLPLRYQQQQLIDGNDLFGYSKLLNWLRDTV